jgi:16S rRNA (guanine1207-N2)-methyltransferase
MAEYYFTEAPESGHRPLKFRTEYRGHGLTFHTDSGVFSRTEIDKGSEALLSMMPETISGDVLDMGCGYGAIGVSLQKANPGCRMTMADINARATVLAEQNARENGVDAAVLLGDGFTAVKGRSFDWIVLNPPIRAGKPVVYQMFTDAAKALNEHGALVLVVRKQQGAPSAAAYLRTLFQTVDVLTKKGGFWVIHCENPQDNIH